MKYLITILGIALSTIAFGQCANLRVEENDYNITTTTPSKIKEFSLTKIWFSDYTPPASLIYLFLNSTGNYLEPDTLLELSKTNNLTIHFADETTVSLRCIIESDYINEQFQYHTVLFLTDEYLHLLSTKKVNYFELYKFKTLLSDRKSQKLIDYLNCMILESE